MVKIELAGKSKSHPGARKAVLFLLFLVVGGAIVGFTNVRPEYFYWVLASVAVVLILGFIIIAVSFPRQNIPGGIVEVSQDGVKWKSGQKSINLLTADLERVGMLYGNYTGIGTMCEIVVWPKYGEKLSGYIRSMWMSERQAISTELKGLETQGVEIIELSLVDNPSVSEIKEKGFLNREKSNDRR